MNCGGSGKKLKNEETAPLLMFWHDGNNGSLSTGSQLKFPQITQEKR
jgi:hypothetical protein